MIVKTPKGTPTKLLELLKSTLVHNGVDYDKEIEDLGQVTALEKRKQGDAFSFADHVKGLILAQFSGSQKWRVIGPKRPQYSEIFRDYDPEYLENVDPSLLIKRIQGIKGGNRSLRSQMQALKRNIKVLRLIEQKFSRLDRFVTIWPPDTVASSLSEPKSEYKLEYVGFPVALEYLRNVGVDAGKPDIHTCRFFGGQRMGYSSNAPATEEEAYKIFVNLSEHLAIERVYLDALVWLLCADGYGQICTAQPECWRCDLRVICNHPGR